MGLEIVLFLSACLGEALLYVLTFTRRELSWDILSNAYLLVFQMESWVDKSLT